MEPSIPFSSGCVLFVAGMLDGYNDVVDGDLATAGCRGRLRSWWAGYVGWVWHCNFGLAGGDILRKLPGGFVSLFPALEGVGGGRWEMEIEIEIEGG